MIRTDSNNETAEADTALALSALTWTLGEETRAGRFLVLTGLTAGDLRSRIDDPTVLAALIRFLEALERDLIACAEEIGATPEALVAARRRLEA